MESNQPQPYTKRPVIIEAIEFTGDNELAIMNFVGKQLSVSKPPNRMEHDRDIPNEGYSILIPTLEGDMLAIRGDYIIKGVKGEFYPCKPDIFSLTYTANQPTGQQLTAEENREKACAASAQDKRLFYTDVKSYMLGFYSGYDHNVQQTTEKDTTIEDIYQQYYDLERKYNEDTAALREELEIALQDHKNACLSIVDLTRQLEAVKKERDETVKERDHFKMLFTTTMNEYKEYILLLGEAVKLLKRYQNQFCIEDEKDMQLQKDNEDFLCRLSSGETKPEKKSRMRGPGFYWPLFSHMYDEHGKILADSECDDIVRIVRRMENPWVSVEDRLPVVGDRYNFINDITHSSFYGEVFGGKYMGCRFGHHEFTLPGHSMTAKYYCPIPAPPESLTDKK